MEEKGKQILEELQLSQSPLMIHQQLMETSSLDDIVLIQNKLNHLVNEEYRSKFNKRLANNSERTKITFYNPKRG